MWKITVLNRFKSRWQETHIKREPDFDTTPECSQSSECPSIHSFYLSFSLSIFTFFALSISRFFFLLQFPSVIPVVPPLSECLFLIWLRSSRCPRARIWPCFFRKNLIAVWNQFKVTVTCCYVSWYETLLSKLDSVVCIFEIFIIFTLSEWLANGMTMGDVLEGHPDKFKGYFYLEIWPSGPLDFPDPLSLLLLINREAVRLPTFYTTSKLEHSSTTV